MAGTRSPVQILYLDESIGFLVPSFLRSGLSSLRSGLSSLRSGLSSPTYRFITQSLQSVCFQTGYLNTDSLTMSYEDMSPLARSRRRGMDIRTHRWCHHCRRPYTRYMYKRHHELHDVHIPVIQATLPLDPGPRQLQDITGQYF